jgi:DNA-binding transcriptional ArsR family regulator
MPLQMIDTTDPITGLVQFRTSAVYEMLISLQTLLKPGARTTWASATRAALPPALMQELAEVYEPYFKGALFIELGVDFMHQDDAPGFIQYIRQLDPATFMFYLVGRILPPDAIARTGFDPETVRAALLASPYESHCYCTEVPLDRILDNVPAFQNRLADLWQWYWEVSFCHQIGDLRPRWENALNEKTALLDRLGGLGLFEHVTGKSELMPPLPADHPVTEIVFIPLYLTPRPAFVFYGYGNITVLFDSERTEARRAQIEQNKGQAITMCKALSDSSRLDILRAIAQHGDDMNGKRIAAKLSLSASAVSRHLSQLKEAGLISEETEDNRTIVYHLQEDTITGLPDLLLDFLYH